MDKISREQVANVWMGEKYKILKDQYIEVCGKKLYRIQALKDFKGVRSGNIGGYIEKESNLSQPGNAWVSGNAWVHGTRHYLNLGPIGSRDGYTTIYRNKSKKAIIVCGCFLGSLDEFERAVHKTHAGAKYEAEYMALIQLARLREKEWLDETD